MKLVEKCVLAITVAAIVVMLVVLSSLFVVSYSPLTFYGMSVENGEACPEESVVVTVDYALNVSDFRELRGIYVKSDWVAVDVPEVEAGSRRPATTDQFLTPDMLEPGRSDRSSRILRIAPQRPGVWHLESIARVYGNKWGIPVPPQKVTESADADTTVLDPADSKCQHLSRGSRDGELVRGPVYGSGARKTDGSLGDLAGVATGEDKRDN